MPPLPDAERQCAALAEQLRPHVGPDTALIGIHSGGVWIAERLRTLLGMPDEPGTIDVSFYRDDFAAKGLHPQIKPSSIPFEVEGRHIVLVDDVLYTGRTTRAALNEIFDYGRPAKVELAVLADRGGRELPVAAQYNTWDVTLAAGETLVLARDDAGRLSWRLDHE
ncbi:bifunctional pyr operon transcriptional regulator/uracil phosphoribosyltransferase PyrR [Azospira restricta]|uniref:Bifunctional pyr operon transcriptional regulator/uracil phosphoribosyltransferase PyrR n=1 Tax=Azospira restricta TaxID=404405 RepID=A0A974Y425_9RHOO|nr:bifunctional pyr operon transcriptional regulator/uracil phosphoribosyltransferase PyrR [Azospira restricta]QRJ64234.1 bifunctional pyr operon transcriptional regulator/uracil phosphoribosyltransferase PyrR [Azospira restricta]